MNISKCEKCMPWNCSVEILLYLTMRSLLKNLVSEACIFNFIFVEPVYLVWSQDLRVRDILGDSSNVIVHLNYCAVFWYRIYITLVYVEMFIDAILRFRCYMWSCTVFTLDFVYVSCYVYTFVRKVCLTVHRDILVQENHLWVLFCVCFNSIDIEQKFHVCLMKHNINVLFCVGWYFSCMCKKAKIYHYFIEFQNGWLSLWLQSKTMISTLDIKDLLSSTEWLDFCRAWIWLKSKIYSV